MQGYEVQKFDNIPAELKQLNNWVLWKLEKRKDKMTKIPYQISGKYASSTDANTWTNFNKAVETFNQKKYILVLVLCLLVVELLVLILTIALTMMR